MEVKNWTAAFLTISFLLTGSLGFTKTFTWPEVIELASKNNLEIQTASLNFQATEALETAAKSGFYPRLSGSVGAVRSAADRIENPDSYTAQLNLSQNIFAGFADLNRRRQAEANTKEARANLRSARAQVSAQLKQAVASYRFATEYKRLAGDTIKRRNDNYKIVDLRFQGGRENKGSVVLSKAYLDEAKYDLFNAEHDSEVSAEDLSRFLGISFDPEIIIADGPPQLQVAKENPDFQRLASESPDVLSLRAQALAADSALSIAKANFVPSLDLSGGYGYIDRVFFPKQDRWSVGLTLTIPLFDGGRDYANVKSSSFRAQSFGKQSEDLFQKKLVRLKQAYYDYMAAIEKEKLDENFRQASLLRSQITRSKYNNGLSTFDEWDRVESDLIGRERAALASRRDRIVKESVWEQAQGVGVFNE